MSAPMALLAGLAVAPANPQNALPGDESPGVPFDVMLGAVIAMAPPPPPPLAAEAPPLEVLFDGEWEPERVDEPDAIRAGEPMILEKNLDNWLTAFSRRERASRPADGDRDPSEVRIEDSPAAEDPATVAELAPPDRLTTVVPSIGLAGPRPDEAIALPAVAVRLNPGAPATKASTQAEREPARELPQSVVIPTLQRIRSAVGRPIEEPIVEIGGFGFPELPDEPSAPTAKETGLQPARLPDIRHPLATTSGPAAQLLGGAEAPELTPPVVTTVAEADAPGDEEVRASGRPHSTGAPPMERPPVSLEELPPAMWSSLGLVKDVRRRTSHEPLSPDSGRPGGQPPNDRPRPESMPLATTAETDLVRIRPVTTERMRAEPVTTGAAGPKAAQPEPAQRDSIRPELRLDVPTDLRPSLPGPTMAVPREATWAPEPRTISGPVPLDRFARRVDHLTLDLRDDAGDYGRIRVSVSGPLVRATIMPNDPEMADRLSLDIRQLKTSLEARGFPEPKVTVQAPPPADPVGWTPIHRDTAVDQPQAGPSNPQRRGEDDRRDRWAANRDQRRDDQRHQDPPRDSRQNRGGDTP